MMRFLPLFLAPSAAFLHIGTSNGKVTLHATKEATFGAGCFWKPAEEIEKASGVIETVAGYTGKADATAAPTYDKVCFSRDWVEGVRVTYDDSQISFEQLLDVFFEAQEPKPGSRQYGSFIFPHDDEQESIAREWVQKAEKTRGDGLSPAFTQIEPLHKFYRAEGYHQNYWAKQRPRFAGLFVLLMIASGVFDRFVPQDMESAIHTAGNTLAIALMLTQVGERFIDNKVVEV